jgi:hypothetical protein
MTPTPRRLTCAALAFALGLALACSREPRAQRGGPLVPWTAGTSTLRAVVAPDKAMALGLPTFAIREPITIDRVELRNPPKSLRLLTARVSFLACASCRRRPGYVGVGGLATSVCVGDFPPASYGPTYEATGLELFPGDAPSLLLYLQADGVGEHAAGGYRIRYHDAARHAFLVEQDNVTLVIEQRPPGGAGVCQRPNGSIWTGGTAGKQQVVPLD